MSFLKNLFNVTKQEVTEKATELFNIAKQEVTEKATEIIADAKDYAKSFTEEDDEALDETLDLYEKWRFVFFVDEVDEATSTTKCNVYTEKYVIDSDIALKHKYFNKFGVANVYCDTFNFEEINKHFPNAKSAFADETPSSLNKFLSRK